MLEEMQQGLEVTPEEHAVLMAWRHGGDWTDAVQAHLRSHKSKHSASKEIKLMVATLDKLANKYKCGSDVVAYMPLTDWKAEDLAKLKGKSLYDDGFGDLAFDAPKTGAYAGADPGV